MSSEFTNRLCHRHRTTLSATAVTVGLAACGLASCAAWGQAGTTPNWSVRTLPTLPGGSAAWGTDVTPLGEVVGYSTTAGTSTPHGFFWNPVTGIMTDMGTLSGNPVDESYSYGVASTAHACGASEFGAGANRDAFIWWPMGMGAAPVGPPPMGHGIGSAEDIELDPMMGLHRVVGYTTDLATGAPHATLWDWEFGVSTNLGTLTGNANDWSRAFGVNTLGDIVGMSTRGGLPTHAFIYQGAVMVDIDNRMTGGSSCAFGVNNATQVVGFYEPAAAGSDAATRWEWRGGSWALTDLGCLPGTSAMDACAQDLNDAALVVGWSFDPVDGNRKACIWLNDQIYDLNGLLSNTTNLQLAAAMGVNLAGEIVGYGYTGAGIAQAFVLRPSTLIMNVPVPGNAGVRNDWYVNGATPGKKVHFTYSMQAGTTAVPGCPGLILSLKNPKVLGSPRADTFGVAHLNVKVPNKASGLLVMFQAAEVSTCRVSNRVDYTFF